MGTAYWASRAVYAAAKLSLPDLLADEPQSAAELAAATHTHAPTLARLLRALAGLGLLSEDVNHAFALTPLGSALKKDAPGSARATILALAGDYWWRGWEQFVYCLQTGETGSAKADGKTVFQYLAQHPEEATYFNEAMIGFHGSEPPAVAAAYDFSAFKTVTDVGGGTGNLLVEILKHHPGPRGILFDQPDVAPEATEFIQTQGLAERVAVTGGDFFKSVPAGSDAYILSHVIHDWTEAQCITILGNCRAAVNPGGRLLIVEMVLPPGDAPHPGKLLDLAMLVMPGGQERTELEYGALLSKAGFRLTRVVPTASPVAVVEAVPA
jgi:hypothetical protein